MNSRKLTLILLAWFFLFGPLSHRTIVTTEHSNFYTGYSIGNQGRGNNALYAYYGITF